jgi:hypothetical protein
MESRAAAARGRRDLVVSRGSAAEAAVAPDRTGLERSLWIAVVALEAAIVAAGFVLDQPFLAAAFAAGVAFFLLAFRVPDVAWALVWITVAPSVEVLFAGGIAVTMPTEPMIGLALLAWFARSLLEDRWTVRPSPIHAPLLALASFTLLSAFWSVSPVATLKAWVMMAGYAAFGYLYWFQSRCDRVRRERWLLLTALTGAAWGLFGIARVLFPAAESGLDVQEVASTYSYGAFRPFFREHGTYAAYLSMFLPAALLLGMDRARRRSTLYALGAVIVALGVLLSFARAGWLAALVVLPATLFLWARSRPDRGRGLLLPALIGAALVVLVAGLGISRQVTRHAGSAVSAENMSNLERFNRWSAAISMARERPLTGVGYGSYLDAYPRFKRRALGTDMGTVRMGTHSEPLKLLSELGIPGLLLALWLVFAVLKLGVASARLLPDPGDRLVALAALAGLSTYLVNGFFNSYLVEDKVTIPFWTAIGIIAALGRRLPARR